MPRSLRCGSNWVCKCGEYDKVTSRQGDKVSACPCLPVYLSRTQPGADQRPTTLAKPRELWDNGGLPNTATSHLQHPEGATNEGCTRIWSRPAGDRRPRSHGGDRAPAATWPGRRARRV